MAIRSGSSSTVLYLALTLLSYEMLALVRLAFAAPAGVRTTKSSASTWGSALNGRCGLNSKL